MLKTYSSLAANAIFRTSKYRFGLSATFLMGNQQRSTEIISLTVEEIDQLSTISHYGSSVELLSQNNLDDSLSQLQFALNDAKNKYSWSVNLQACLLNRMSILVKLLNRKKRFEALLEELYLISLSSKGSKSLDTIKNLVNYLICLTIYSPNKCSAVLQFLSQKESLPDYALFFDGLNDIRSKYQLEEGIRKLSSLPEGAPYQKIFKYNNLAYMKLYSLKLKFQNAGELYRELLASLGDILDIYLRALLEAERNPEQFIQYSQEETTNNELLQKHIEAYLHKEKTLLPTDKLSNKKILRHSNSHIISMNIASLLFQAKRMEESFYFLKLSLDKAINENELERVGVALILLGKYYYLHGEQKWEQTYIEILEHSSTYPKSIINRLLFEQGRSFEGENYLQQALSIDAESGIEGLILPSYDFSF